MNLARVSANGQINTSATALKRAQKAFRGVAAEMGLRNDDDVQALIDEVRHDAGH